MMFLLAPSLLIARVKWNVDRTQDTPDVGLSVAKCIQSKHGSGGAKLIFNMITDCHKIEIDMKALLIKMLTSALNLGGSSVSALG